MHKILDLVSNPEIKWTKSRSRLEARDWRKQNLDLVSKVKLGISSMSATYLYKIKRKWETNVISTNVESEYPHGKKNHGIRKGGRS